MKKFSWIFACIGVVGGMMAVTSCSSTGTDGDGYSSEAALPVSEVAEGELPPWLLEDDGSAQVSAGAQTPAVASRNDYAIPEPGETEASSTAVASQNQPEVTTAGQDVPVVEGPTTTPATSGVDPLAAGTNEVVDTPAVKPAESAEPEHVVKPARPGGKRAAGKNIAGTGKQAGGRKSSGRKVAQGRKPKQPTMIVYKVRPGDNLTVIAKRSNTTVEQIRKDSGIKGSMIYPGQTIKVRYTPAGYKPGKGSKAGGKTQRGSKARGKAATREHTVKSGQTLSGIAAKYGVSTSALMKANGITKNKAAKIRPGQKIKVPTGR